MSIKKKKKNNQDKQKLYTVKSSLLVGEGGVRCFVSNPCPQIFILMNNTSIGLKCIKIIPNFYQRYYIPMNKETFGSRRTLTPSSKNDSSVYIFYK